MEILGYVGILIWVAVTLLRNSHLSNNAIYLFFIGILPNLGAAWTVTMFSKWIIIFLLKQKYTVKKHCILCFGITFLALGSEIIHDLFLNSSFDFYDMLITVIAQLIMFFLPILIKDKYFKNYS